MAHDKTPKNIKTRVKPNLFWVVAFHNNTKFLTYPDVMSSSYYKFMDACLPFLVVKLLYKR